MNPKNFSILFGMTSPNSLTEYFGFGYPGNDKMLSIITLYIEMMSILLGIVLVITFTIIYMVVRFNGVKNRLPMPFSAEAEVLLDIFFAVIPTLVITYLLIPALGFLSQVEYDENFLDTLFNVYIIGHQWYWSYELDTKLGSDILVNFFDPNFVFPALQFDSYMSQESDVSRLLEVDKSLVLPSGYHICLYVTSHDVIHSWSVPQLGVKVDAIPGRLMQCILYASSEGVYYGQCSELCGINHAFMPICVEIVNNSQFLDWLLLSMDSTLVQDMTTSFDGYGEMKELTKEPSSSEDSEASSSSRSEYIDILAPIFLGFLIPLEFETGVLSTIASSAFEGVQVFFQWCLSMDGGSGPGPGPGPGVRPGMRPGIGPGPGTAPGIADLVKDRDFTAWDCTPRPRLAQQHHEADSR